VSDDRRTVLYLGHSRCAPGAASSTPALVVETAEAGARVLLDEFRDGFFRLSVDGRSAIVSRESNGLDVLAVADGRPDPGVRALPAWFRADGAISRDGNLIAAIRQGVVNVYDRSRRASDQNPLSTTDGAGPNKPLWITDVSANGRFLLLTSAATNLTAGPSATGHDQLYLYDRQAMRLSLVTQDGAGRAPGAACWQYLDRAYAVGEDGQWVAFTCNVGTLSLLGAPARSRAHLYARHMPTGRTWLVDSAPLTAYNGNPTYQGVQIFGSDLLVVDRYRGADASPNRAIYWMTLPTGRRADRVLDGPGANVGGRRLWSDKARTSIFGQFTDPLKDFSSAGCLTFQDTSQICPKR
jgi:hypothetical protein